MNRHQSEDQSLTCEYILRFLAELRAASVREAATALLASWFSFLPSNTFKRYMAFVLNNK